MKVSKKVLKVLSTVLAMLMLTSALGACTSKEKETSGDDTLTFWGIMDGNASAAGIMRYSDMMMFQELEKRTGIKVEFLHPIQGSTGNEAFATMIATSERPDIMEYSWQNYTGGAKQAIEDGVVIALNDYLEEYAPNYYEYMEGEKGKEKNYAYKLESTTEDGLYYGFNRLNIGNSRCFSGIYIRGDKLKEWNMEIPETIDEWTNVFKKAKEEGFEKPFTSTNSYLSFKQPYAAFNAAYEVGTSFYLEDGKVVFAPFQKGYKDYVAQMAQWVKDGYIDSGFVTNDSKVLDGNIANSISIATYGWISSIGALTEAGKKLDPDFELVACPVPSHKKGETARVLYTNGEATHQAFAISTQCENYLDAIKWCDYWYSEEGNILRTFGIEGDTFTTEEREDGTHYVYTDKIMKPENSGVNTVSEALYKHMLPANHPGLVQHPDYLDGYYPYQAQKDALKMWNEDIESARAFYLPEIPLTEDEASEETDILEVAEPELEVAILDIMLGKASIDTYDDAIKKAKENDYERVIEIYQAAYDRYLEKLN